MIDRRLFVSTAAAAATCGAWAERIRATRPLGGSVPRFGLVTYLWGRDLERAALIAACEASRLDGVELRTTHAHGVEPSLAPAELAEVRAQFDDSPVTLVGLGSDERFDSPDPARLEASMASVRRFLKCSAALGATGVKVKPDSFHRGVERTTTIDQIGRSLAALGPFASDHGQELRLEVHGGCADPRIIEEIVSIANHPAIRVCWNCNTTDLRGPGFGRHYDRLRPHFGQTMHVRELDTVEYPIVDLLERVSTDGYDGFVLLEAHTPPPRHRVSALSNQRAIFDARTRPIVAITDRSLPIRITPRRNAPNQLDVRAGADAFCTVRLGPAERTPAIFPLHAPGERLVVRAFPFERRPGESTDHPHHRGLWFAHGDVGGLDFWHDPACRVVVRRHETVGDDTIRFVADWVGPRGRVAIETRTLRFSARPDRHRIETAIELVPIRERLVLGDTKEGLFAMRLAPTLRVEGSNARGRLENAEGVLDRDCWGRRSARMIAEGPIGGRLVRVTVEDHEENPGFPTHWHARPYGLLAANPFGRRAFEGPEARSGATEFTPETPLRLRYVTTLETRPGLAGA